MNKNIIKNQINDNIKKSWIKRHIFETKIDNTIQNKTYKTENEHINLSHSNPFVWQNNACKYTLTRRL